MAAEGCVCTTSERIADEKPGSFLNFSALLLLHVI